MKKFLFIIIVCIISMFAFAVGCNEANTSQSSSPSENNGNHQTSNEDSTVGKSDGENGQLSNSPPYVVASIFDQNKQHLYSTSIHFPEPNKDDAPQLTLGVNYYIYVQVGPGSRFTDYERTWIEFSEQQIVVSELPELFDGEIYLLQGLQECETMLTVNALTNSQTIQCKFWVKFVSN